MLKPFGNHKSLGAAEFTARLLICTPSFELDALPSNKEEKNTVFFRYTNHLRCLM